MNDVIFAVLAGVLAGLVIDMLAPYPRTTADADGHQTSVGAIAVLTFIIVYWVRS